MAKVFVVTSGCYSDYHIEGIFSTRKLAEEWVAKAAEAARISQESDYERYISGGESSADVAEWELDGLQKARIFKRWGYAIFLDTGAEENEISESEEFGLPHNEIHVSENIPIHNGRGAVRVTSCKSAEHAKKLAVEARQKWLREKKT